MLATWQLTKGEWRTFFTRTWPIKQISTWLALGIGLISIELIWLAFYSLGQESAITGDVSPVALAIGLLGSLNWGFWWGYKQQRSISPYQTIVTLRYWQSLARGMSVPLAIGFLVLLPTYFGAHAVDLSVSALLVVTAGGIVVLQASLLFGLAGIVLALVCQFALNNQVFRLIIWLTLVWSINYIVISQPVLNGIAHQFMTLDDNLNQLLVLLAGQISAMVVFVTVYDLLGRVVPRTTNRWRYSTIKIGTGTATGFGSRSTSFILELLRLARWQGLLIALTILIPVLVVSRLLLILAQSQTIWLGLILGLVITLINFRVGFSSGAELKRFSTRFRFLPDAQPGLWLARLSAAAVVSFGLAAIIAWLALRGDNLQIGHAIWLVEFSLVSLGLFFGFGRVSASTNYQPTALIISLVVLAVMLISW